ncbi:MAG: ArnT family glycosyltransferase [Pyrinomonadaceae bacterium]
MTKFDSAIRIPSSGLFWVLLAMLALAAYFAGLTLPFVGPDEPRYAQVAREMFERGDWVTPTLGGFNWFEKPALLYWFEIASYHLFGVNEFAARLGPALCGLGTVASLWLLGRGVAKENAETYEMADGNEPVSKIPVRPVAGNFPYWLALIAASTLGILVFSHGASFDIIITFPVTVSLVGFFIFDQAKRRSFTTFHLPLISFYFFIGIALLAKGLVGIIFPFAIVGFYHVLAWKFPTRSFVISLLWGTTLALAVAAIWYVPMYLRHGWPFIDEFIIQHHFQRFTSNKYQHPQPFYFFLWILPLMILPWAPFFFAGVWTYGKGLIHKRGVKTETAVEMASPLDFSTSPLLLFSAAWLAVPLVFFSLSGSKLPGYILPAVPAAVIFAGVYVFKLVEKNHKWRTAVMSAAGLVFLSVILLAIFMVPRFADGDSVSGLITASERRGYTSEPVFCLHTISHSAEFYAAGRLLRDPDGKQKKLYSPAEIVSEMQRANAKTALVLVPLEYQKQLTESSLLTAEMIRDNGELAIYAIRPK